MAPNSAQIPAHVDTDQTVGQVAEPSQAPTQPQTVTLPEGRTPSGAFRDEIVADVVKGWRHELAELGGPNTLLWYRDLPEGALDLTTVHPGGVSMLMAGGSTRLSHLVRERSAFVEARRRARVIREKALELRGERGLVTCFMALGMATWDVPGLRAPAAPVLLRSCEIHPVDASGTDYDLDLGTEVEVNPVLLNYLRHSHGIDLDPKALAALAAVSTRFDPMRVFRELGRVCAGIPGFTVHDRRIVSTFSYTKLPMVSDLSRQGMALGDHEVLAALASVPGARSLTDGAFTGPLDPGQELLAFDADSTQSKAVVDIRRGHDLALVGGPGTGKTRTVANMVAALAAEGRSVLYVAPARRSIDALTAELDEAGLAGLVQDVHGTLPDSQALAQDIITALDRRRPAREPDTRGLREQLRDVGAEIESNLAAIHTPRAPWGVSVFHIREKLAAQAQLADAPSSDVVLPASVVTGLDADEVAVIGELLASVAEADGWSKDWPRDPWYRAWITTDEEAQRAERLVKELASGRLAAARRMLDSVLVEAGLPPAETPDHWDGALDLMLGVRKTLEVAREDVFLQPLDYLLGATADRRYRQERGLHIGWRKARELRRRAESLIAPEVGLDQVYDVLAAAHEQRTAWVAWSGNEDVPRVPARLDEARALWAELDADLRWLSERLDTTAEGGELYGITVDELVARMDDLSKRRNRIAVLPRVATALDRCLAAGFEDVIADLARRKVPAAKVPAEVERIWWRSLLERISAEDPRLGRHDADRARGLVDEFVRLDHDHLRASRDEVRVGIARRLHDAAGAHAREQEIVRFAASGTGAGVPALHLFAQTADLLLDVKPCWAMSPEVVAALIPVGQWFDVVIVDDAQSMLTSHAVSALSRGARAVIVGDDALPMPLPYSTAPEEPVDPDSTVPADQGPSLLEVAKDTLTVRRLTTVHRAVDEAFLHFGNTTVRDGELVVVPSTTPGTPIRVVVPGRDPQSASGAADLAVPGDHGDLVLDAPALEDPQVATVLSLVRTHRAQHPDESLLVVTLGTDMATRIQAAMDTAAELDTDLRAWLGSASSEADRVVVVDRVLGAQRDAVILVLGYGPEADGSFPRRFGRLESDGGDQLLAAAMAIPQKRLTVVTGISSADFADRRPATAGAVLLRDFVTYCEGVERGESVATTGEEAAQSPLLRPVARALEADGLKVRPDHGTGDLRIDLAVGEAEASLPVVAMQLDSPGHAAITDIRDRERVRTELLRRNGWEVVRLWSADLPGGAASAVPAAREAIRAVDARQIMRGRRTGGRL